MCVMATAAAVKPLAALFFRCLSMGKKLKMCRCDWTVCL